MRIATVLLVQRERSRRSAALMHALGRAAVPREVLPLRPVQRAQIPRPLLVGRGRDIGAVVVVEEDGIAGDVGDGPVERVGELAVEGGESVALGVPAAGEVARMGGVGAAGAGAGADVAAVAIVYAEDEAGWQG